ncbi:MAG: hypothetical protein HYR72_23415 [Deltaproteobacteria bacterium]|nr:hypothetical protein [Deltaproteobacteria bacterium]MBI3389049.1 hypothetical protein [Deltaproteobacteria bacterium]
MLRRIAIVSGIALGALGLMAGIAAAQSKCTGLSCAVLSVSNVSGKNVGDTVNITVSYKQSPDDGTAGQGSDETAALAFTLGMPGTGSGAGLSLADCNVGSDGLTPAVHVADGVKNNFKVVIENLQCTTSNGTPRNRCLCPGTGQQTDNFINVVVYGPKDLPSSGPVDIPVLPSEGPLVSFDLKINAGGRTDLHVFTETDVQATTPKPQFGAFLSIGDKAAVDQTYNHTTNTAKVAITDGFVEAGASCVGDCDGMSGVTVEELIRGVNIALGSVPLSVCPSFDADHSDDVTVEELVQGVNNALLGCGHP